MSDLNKGLVVVRMSFDSRISISASTVDFLFPSRPNPIFYMYGDSVIGLTHYAHEVIGLIHYFLGTHFFFVKKSGRQGAQRMK